MDKKKIKSIIWVLISSLAFSIMSVFFKLVNDTSIFEKLMIRNLIPLVISFVLIIKNKNKIYPTKHFKLIIVRSVIGTLGVILSFYTLAKISLSDFSIISRLTPIFVLILSIIFLKERIEKYKIIWILTVLLGSYIAINPSYNSNIYIILISILGAFLSAVAYTCLNKLGKEINSNVLLFYSSIISFIILVPLNISNYTILSYTDLIYLLLSGVFACCGQYALTFAYQISYAKDISIYEYTNIIFSATLAVLFFNYQLTINNIIGYTLIMVGVIFINKKKKKACKMPSK